MANNAKRDMAANYAIRRTFFERAHGYVWFAVKTFFITTMADLVLFPQKYLYAQGVISAIVLGMAVPIAILMPSSREGHSLGIVRWRFATSSRSAILVWKLSLGLIPLCLSNVQRATRIGKLEDDPLNVMYWGITIAVLVVTVLLMVTGPRSANGGE